MMIKPAIDKSVRAELVEGFIRIEGGMLRQAQHDRRLEIAGCRLLLLCLIGLTGACGSASHQQEVKPSPQHAAHRIVALAPNLAELVYAAGAGEYLVGTVDYADYPEAAKSVPRVGDALHVDYERLLALKPDLILVWPSGTLPSVIEQVKALRLPIQEIDAQRIAEVGKAVRLIGVLAGTEPIAEQAAAKFEHDMQVLREKYFRQSRLSVFIEVNRQPLYTVNKQQIISEVVDLCGGDNVFADLNQLAPVIDVEAVLKVNPQVIVSTDGTTDVITQDWKAWPQLQAVHNNHVYSISPDAINRAAPRLVQGAEEVCRVLDGARGNYGSMLTEGKDIGRMSVVAVDGRWIEVGGSKYHQQFDPGSLQSDLWRYVKNKSKVHFREGTGYIYQFQFVTKNELLLMASCEVDKEFDLGAHFYQVKDGGSCFFEARYSFDSRRFSGLYVHGEA